MSMQAFDAAILWSLDFDAELPCEAEHRHSGKRACLHVATYHRVTCRKNDLICDIAAQTDMRTKSLFDLCGGCGKGIKDCWTITKL